MIPSINPSGDKLSPSTEVTNASSTDGQNSGRVRRSDVIAGLKAQVRQGQYQVNLGNLASSILNSGELKK